MTAPVLGVNVDPRCDERVILRGISWAQYRALAAARGESAVPRLTWVNGVLEIMSPSYEHEGIKTRIGRLLEAWSEERGLALEGFGSWTLGSGRRRGGLEPDECYVRADRLPRGTRPKRPDLALEVVWTHGGLDKLEVYRRLDVPEVWVWERGAITVWTLGSEGYVRSEASAVLPGIDVAFLASLVFEETQLDAVRKLRARLRGTGG